MKLTLVSATLRFTNGHGIRSQLCCTTYIHTGDVNALCDCFRYVMVRKFWSRYVASTPDSFLEEPSMTSFIFPLSSFKSKNLLNTVDQ